MSNIIRQWQGLDWHTRQVLDEIADMYPYRRGRGQTTIAAWLHDGAGELVQRELDAATLRRYAQALHAAADWLNTQNAPGAGEEEVR